MGKKEKKIQSLQNKIEKMEREYGLRIRELKDQIQKKMKVKSVGHESSSKVKDLEAQVSIWNLQFSVLKETYPWSQLYFALYAV